MGLGQLSFIGIAKEAVWGTAVAATDWLKFNTESITKAVEELISAQQPARRDEPESYPGLRTVSGDTVHEVHPNGVGYYLRSALGAPVTTELVAGKVYQHVFEPLNTPFHADCQNPPYTLEICRNISTKSFQYTGMVANVLSFAFGAAAKILGLTVSWLGKSVTVIDKTTPTLEATNPFMWDQAVIKIGGSEYKLLETLNFTLNNGLIAIPLLNNTNEVTKIIGDTFRLGTIAPTFLLDDLDEYNQYGSFAQRAFEIKFTGDAIPDGGGAFYELTIKFPKVLYTAFPPVIAGPGRILAAVTGKIKYDSVTGYLCQITLKNSKVSY